MTSTDVMVSDVFDNAVPAAAFKAASAGESLADGIGTGYGVITYKGKVWRLRHRGQSYTFTRPDDGTPAPFLDVIVLRAAPYKSKSYYPRGSYNEGDVGTRPVCAALDGVTPDADIAHPQATACAICPRNEFKLNDEGRKSRECSDYKRLAVLLTPTVTARLLGAALMEPVFLRIPPASLNDIAKLGEDMDRRGFPYYSFVMRIGFDPEKPHPQMKFKAIQKLGDAEAPVVLPLRDDPTAFRITGEHDITKPRIAAGITATVIAGPDPAIAAAAAALAAAEAAKVAAAKAAAEETATIDTGFASFAQPTAGAGVVIDVKPTVVVKQAAPAEELVEVGFSNLGLATAQPAESAGPTKNTVDDTGEPDVADVDLDAKVASLLAR